ncbi:MAG: hypothetical protein ACK53Y_22295, partial [bacterium]
MGLHAGQRRAARWGPWCARGGGGRRRSGSRLLTPPHLPFALRGARTGSRPGCRPRRRPEPWGVASKSSSPQRLRLTRSRACWASSDTGSLASLPSQEKTKDGLFVLKHSIRLYVKARISYFNIPILFKKLFDKYG